MFKLPKLKLLTTTILFSLGMILFTIPSNFINATEVLKPVPLDSSQAINFIDIRGVGDAGMALTYQQPLPPDFGKKVDMFDPSGESYRADLSFINWESVVGNYCNQFRGKPSGSSYTFVSHPDNLAQAYQRGFNLIGLANNHSWDCPKGEQGKYGALVSAQHMQRLTTEIPANWLWHGVGEQKTTAQVKTLNIKGKDLKIAFASVYLGGACDYITCISDITAILQSLKSADADVRILSLHSWNDDSQRQLVALGKEFIKNYNGDIVFGHGPHEWKPVTIVTSASGKQGVIFESLGNFIHPSLAPRANNLIGRVLLDLDTLKVRQIQAIPFRADGDIASFSGSLSAKSIPASNFTWQEVTQTAGDKKIQTVYMNISN